MIKGWWTQHKDTGKWHQIEDVKDTGIPAHKEGGGNVVKLKGKDKWVHASKLSGMEPKMPMEKADKIKGGLADKKKPSDFDSKQLAMGIKVEMEHTNNKELAREIAMDHLIEDPQYYTKLKEVEKYDRVDEEADGKKELDYGSEELDKIKSRWKKLRKALDNSTAIMDISGQEYQDDEDSDTDGGQPDDDGSPSDQPAPEGDAAQDQQQEGDGGDEGEGQGAESQGPDEQDLEQMLRDEGYSDAEIAHIVHGHVIPSATIDDVKMGAEQAESDHDLSHKKRMAELEYEQAKAEADPSLDKDHKKRMLDLEYEAEKKKKSQSELELEHKKRMLDLEYHKAKQEADKRDPSEEIKRKQLEFELEMKRKEKELELQFKEKELRLKLELQKEAARQKAEHQAKQAEEDAKVNAAVKKEQSKHKIAEAKNPPVKEKADK